MIVEMRQYSLVPGKLPEFLALYEKNGWPVQSAHLGACLGYYTTEIGDLNGVVHMWAYEDISDRARRRAAMNADPDWQRFLAQVAPCLARMTNTLLRPTSFAKPTPVTTAA